MPTTGSGLFPYPNSSAVPDVPADILLLAQRVAKIGGSGIAPVADSTERAALVTNGDAFEGLFVYQVDTKVLYVYQSAAWVAFGAQPGLVPVIPTSVAAGSGTATVGTGGKVTVTTVGTTLSVNGCFTSTYENYLVIANLSHSTSANFTMRLRASGSDDSSSNYDLQTLSGSSTSASAAQVLAATSWGVSGINSSQENISIEFNSPQIAVATQGLLTTRALANPMTSSHGLGYRMLQHRSSTAYDGFTLIPSAGTTTGSIRIYGYTNN